MQGAWDIRTIPLLPGNTRPPASALWEIDPARRHFIGDHLQMISEGDEVGASEGDGGCVAAVDIIHENADEIVSAQIGEAQIHVAVGRNIEVGHSGSFRVRFDTDTIAEGGAVQDGVLNICDRVPGGLSQ